MADSCRPPLLFRRPVFNDCSCPSMLSPAHDASLSILGLFMLFSNSFSYSNGELYQIDGLITQEYQNLIPALLLCLEQIYNMYFATFVE